MQESPFILEIASPAGRLSTPLHAKENAYMLGNERCFWLQGLDGWGTNDHLRGKIFPERLADKINHFIDEDNAITEDA